MAQLFVFETQDAHQFSVWYPPLQLYPQYDHPYDHEYVGAHAEPFQA